MKAQTQDPYAHKERSYWTVFFRQFQWISFWAVFFAQTGCLKVVVIRRWLNRELAQMEHGLRALLINGVQFIRVSPAKTGVQLKQEGRAKPDFVSCLGPKSSLEKRKLALSVSLKQFGHPQPAAPAHPGKGRDLELVARDPVLQRDERVELSARLNAILDVFENTEFHLQRMAAQIKKLGGRIRRRTWRPSGAAKPNRVDSLPGTPTYFPPILDSS